MIWRVEFHDGFDEEFKTYPLDVQEAIAAEALLLEAIGPHLGRPHSDTLKGSKFANMKELRFSIGRQAWRVAYAFDPSRTAILLAAGNKSGVSQNRFYKTFITIADKRLSAYLALQGKRSK